MHLLLFDDHAWDQLLPLTFTRPVSGLRIGILTIAEKWVRDAGVPVSPLTRPHLQGKYPPQAGTDSLLVNAALLPGDEVKNELLSLKAGEALKKGPHLLGAKTSPEEALAFDPAAWMDKANEYQGKADLLTRPWQIFALNGQEIAADFGRITAGRSSAKLSPTVRVTHPERVFVEEGFSGEHFSINAAHGPVYLGPGSEIMEGSLIRGPFALCEGALVKMGAKIYGPTTLGPYSKVGGEINNAVLQANSNKAHDGYLGNAVLGEWCNLGADTNNSNLKNNYAEVKLWSYPEGRFISTGSQFCGLIMGDHSKCGINTMFNTGTVVGVSANIFGPGFPRNFVPSFSWGGAGGYTTYKLEKALETARLVMQRRHIELSSADEEILSYAYRFSEAFRK